MRHVMILAGGLSHERDVSLRSGRRVADALNRAGCETHVRDVVSSLLEVLVTTRPDVVCPVLHGAPAIARSRIRNRSRTRSTAMPRTLAAKLTSGVKRSG